MSSNIVYSKTLHCLLKNVIMIVPALTDTLCALDEAGAEEYRGNCESYCAKLDELDAAFRDIVAEARAKAGGKARNTDWHKYDRDEHGRWTKKNSSK